MKTQLIRFTRTALGPVAAILLSMTAASAPASAATTTKNCYAVAQWDRDGDGFADKDAVAVALEVRDGKCPSGYVEKAGDCNDNNNLVHPHRQEVGFNGVDDNCNGMIDEPEFRYGDVSLNTRTSVTLRFAVNHSDLRDALRAGRLYAKVKYFKLSASANGATLPLALVSDDGNGWASITVTGLSAGTVYALRPYFYGDAAGTSNIGPNAGDSHLDTERYYTMTDSGTEKVHKRFLIVMRGLNERNNFEGGLVGYRGTFPDGTRYGAEVGEAWCTEFYAWVTKLLLSGVDGNASTADMRAYFRHWGSWYVASEIPGRAAPGDYLYLDTDQDGDANHSAMFLAYDTSVAPAQVWTLEGNAGNGVYIKQRTADWDQNWPQGDKIGPVFLRLGYITNAMLL